MLQQITDWHLLLKVSWIIVSGQTNVTYREGVQEVHEMTETFVIFRLRNDGQECLLPKFSWFRD